MFCVHCGKELNDEWIKCPYCGGEVKRESESHKKSTLENEKGQETVSGYKEYKLLGSRRTGRFSFEYIPTHIQVEQENVRVTIHRKKSIEKQFNKSEVVSVTLPLMQIWNVADIIRLIIFGFMVLFSYGLGLFAVIFAISLATTRHIKIKLNNGQIIKIPICQKADASDFLRELNYPEEEIKKNNEKRISDKKWSFREWLRTVILALIAGATLAAGISMWGDKSQGSDSEMKQNIEGVDKDVSDIDFEKIIGQPGENLKEVGVSFDKEQTDYTLLDGNIYILCVDEEVSMVMLKGVDEKMPNFHGTRIGMSEENAEELLKDTYMPNGIVDNKILYTNYDAGIDLMLAIDNGVIAEISAVKLSDEELQEYIKENEESKKEEEKAEEKEKAKEEERKAEEEKKAKDTSKEYIFPDSDKKYLTEDEVLKVDVNKLKIARNEIFARHGYIFKSEDLKKYFESTSWYKGTIKADKFNSDKVFNDFEKKNVELIKRIEDEINGASSAKKFIGIEGEYQCGSDMDAGIINVWDIRDGFVYMDIGTHEYPYLLESVEGEIIDDHTVSYRGMTFIWTDTASLYVIDVPAGFSDVIWEGLDYLIADYYHVS